MRPLLGIVLVAATLVLGSCTTFPLEKKETAPARFDAIDEMAGTYGSVGIGSSPTEIARLFGKVEPLVREGPFQPTGADEFRGPTFIRADVGYAYEDVLFWLSPSDPEHASERRAVAGFQVTSTGAPTVRGVEVGDDLDEVRASYPKLECGEAPAGESPFGNTTFPYCSGRVATDRWIWFGGDPVANISVASARFRDP